MPANPLDAYQEVEKATLTGRELEASVLMRAAMRLAELRNNWDAPGRESELDDALRYNQRIWTVFQAELLDEENPLPEEIKRNLISLSAFVDRRTFDVMAFPDADKLDILISINKNIAAGLRGEAA
ncbi:flagellar biosynthesis regulatory protein FlaF [Parasulfuritortus cantonensis]|uniref:Flagellar biosynthesis regulatory protein FlaF n=1 Tax=Parasulfuritortus cantonensis TaxID=2528202 RepID=A0A4R1BKK3_9PROT|nr:flagellar biosynthesis regulator FlaF [Parasulfuritortus cantonensis]TCJ17955.1 flagellar biosynthesis regulatory protein FlaF [Parasulfuritortus cantonensis]